MPTTTTRPVDAASTPQTLLRRQRQGTRLQWLEAEAATASRALTSKTDRGPFAEQSARSSRSPKRGGGAETQELRALRRLLRLSTPVVQSEPRWPAPA